MHRATEKERIGKNGAFFVKFSYLEKNEKFSNRRFRVQNTQKMEVVGKMRSSGEDGDAHATDKLTKSGRRSKFRSTSFLLFCKRVPKLFGNGNYTDKFLFIGKMRDLSALQNLDYVSLLLREKVARFCVTGGECVITDF